MDAKRIQLINAVIARIPVFPGQITLFKILYERSDHWISIFELANAVYSDDASVTGVLGALGNRINGTEGINPPFDGIGLLMEWGTFHDEAHYRILPEFREAIDNFPVLQNAIKLSVHEIREQFKNGLVV